MEIKNPKDAGKIYDIFEQDVLNYGDITSLDISAKGIKLGDSVEKVFEVFGEPDETKTDTGTVITYGYGESLGLETNGIYFFTNENKVNSIIVMNALNPKLHGETKINRTLSNIYSFFGKPEKQEDLPKVRRFTYPKKGLEVYIERKKMISFAFIEPYVYENPHIVD